MNYALYEQAISVKFSLVALISWIVRYKLSVLGVGFLNADQIDSSCRLIHEVCRPEDDIVCHESF